MDLRVGILSDVHVNNERPAQNFERALRYFDARKVDAVLIAGDLVVDNRLREFKLMAGTWFKVFPDDRRSDGVKIERLFVTGNHDVDGFAYGAKYKSLAEAKEDGFFPFCQACSRATATSLTFVPVGPVMIRPPVFSSA